MIPLYGNNLTDGTVFFTHFSACENVFLPTAITTSINKLLNSITNDLNSMGRIPRFQDCDSLSVSQKQIVEDRTRSF